MRIGPTMRTLEAIVSARPGISKAGALRAAGLPVRGYDYLAPRARTEAAGLIIVDSGRPCRLFTSELARKKWYAERELMSCKDAERAAQILAEIEELRRQQARSYAESQQGSGQ